MVKDDNITWDPPAMICWRAGTVQANREVHFPPSKGELQCVFRKDKMWSSPLFRRSRQVAWQLTKQWLRGGAEQDEVHAQEVGTGDESHLVVVKFHLGKTPLKNIIVFCSIFSKTFMNRSPVGCALG